MKTKNLKELKNDNDKLPLGNKDSKGKAHIEYNWDFLQEQMNRLGKYKIENGGKYEYENWKNPIEILELKKALLRHTLAVMNNQYEDEGDEYGHLAAISLNALFIYTQLKNKKLCQK